MPDVPLVRLKVVPSTTVFSLVPSTKPLTVKVSPLTVWPASMVLMLAPEKAATAEAWALPAASVKVGLDAVAASVGASLVPLTVMVTVWVAVAFWSSVTVTMKVSVRWSLAERFWWAALSRV